MLTPSPTSDVTLPEPPPELPRLLGYRRRDFARAVGVSLTTVERWIANGDLRVAKIGGTIVIPAAEAARVLTPIESVRPSGDAA